MKILPREIRRSPVADPTRSRPDRTGSDKGVAPPNTTVATLAISSSQWYAGLVSAAIIIAALYFGRDILMPLLLAFLVGFVLSPLVERLHRWGVPQTLAVTLVVAASLTTLVLAGLALGGQVRELSAELPTYRTTIQTKVRDLRQRIDAPGIFDGAFELLDTVKKEVERKSPDQRGALPSRPVQRVQIEVQEPSPIAQARVWLEAGLGPLAMAGIVLVFVFLVLKDRQDLRDRLTRLLGGNLHRTTDAMNEAGERISRYLIMQLIVNACFGIPMAIGLWVIGVPGAIVWGALATVMRFVPYIGAMVFAFFPLALAFAVDPGWSLLLWTIALIGLLELFIVNVIEPWTYGASTGLSAMSLIVSASFWTALWGPIGLVISTPLTVCLLVIGRHLPQLQFLDVLLGSQPALDAPTRLYQRLLSGDVEEAIDLASDHAADASVADFYDKVGIPALRRASDDHDAVSTSEHRLRVVTGMDRVIDELREQSSLTASPSVLQVVCIGGKWEIDTLAARMLAHALSLNGINADYRAAGLSDAAFFQTLDLLGATTVCLSHFSHEPQTQARYLCRRLRRRWPDLHIALVLWNPPTGLLEETSYRALGADSVAASIEEAVMIVGQHHGARLADEYQPAPVPAADVERVRALRASGVLGEHLRPQFEVAAKRAADVFDVRLALVSMIDDELQLICGVGGELAGSVQAITTDSGEQPAIPRSLSVCGHVVASAETLIVEDIARDPRFANNPVLHGRGLRFYAGAPLRDARGTVYGSLCLLDTAPRVFTERETRLLEGMAAELMGEVLKKLDGSQNTASAAVAPALPPHDLEPPSATVGQAIPN